MNPNKDQLWRDGLPHLATLPHWVRVQAIQAGIQTWGPVPNDLGDQVRKLLSNEKNPVGERHPERSEMARDMDRDGGDGRPGAPDPAGVQTPVEAQPQKAGGVPVPGSDILG